MTERAAAVVAAIAEKLSDPAKVMAAAGETPLRDRSPWTQLTLACGNPAVSLLFAELGDRERTHQYLSAGLVDPDWAPRMGLYGGMGSLAFAAHAAARSYGGYATLLSQFDEAIATGAIPWARTEKQRIEAGEPIGSWSYDVISGFTGVARHLLSRYENTGDPTTYTAVTELLSTLVAIATADDTKTADQAVPAWWVDHSRHRQTDLAHLNFGVAHGIAGPLALLAIAWRSGLRVPRHDEAVERLAALLFRWQATDSAGPYWPHVVSRLDDPIDGRSRDVWCYGTAGVARALDLAAEATENAGWRTVAHQALDAALSTADGITDYGLCHGWAGLLRIATVMGRDGRTIADRICDAYDENSPFGFRANHPDAASPLNRPGFLEGAAGIALALNAYLTPPRTGWDTALLLT